MATIRGRCWLLVAAFLLLIPLASRAHDNVPIAPLPQHPFYFKRFQPWAGYVSDYGGRPKSNEGWFGGVQWLSWWNRGADAVDIGDPNEVGTIVADGSYFRPGLNSFNTGDFERVRGNGMRYEVGYVADNWGWLASVINLQTMENQNVISDAEIMFRDQFTPHDYFELFEFFIPDPDDPGEFIRIIVSEPRTRDVGFLDGFVDQSPQDTVDDNQNNNIQFGRYWDGNNNGVIDPTDLNDILEPQFYDLGDLVRLAVVFRELKVTQRTNIRGVELMPFFRTEQLHKGGHFDLLFGGRYFRYDERFWVFGYGEYIPYLNDNANEGPFVPALGHPQNSTLLGNSRWLTRAVNDIVGPQIGGRYANQKGRWIIDVSGRFLAGVNFQTIQQQVHLENARQPSLYDTTWTAQDPRQLGSRGANTFLAFTPRTVTHTRHFTEFSPMVEARVNLGYRVTKALSAQVGWTGIVAHNVARPSSMVEYTLPAMGINEKNRQTVFLQGLNLGVEFNR